MDFEALIGKTLVGRFRLDAELGKGGFGAVFKATQLSVGRTCAVKILTNVTEGSTDLERFEREARLTSVIDHPNSVVLYDFGHDPEHNLFFIAMEYLDGYSVREIHDVLDEPPTTEECLHILRQAASSLDHAHQSGLVHRDIKPHNIMVVPKPDDPFRVRVIDFGLAKSNSGAGSELSAELTQKDSVIGTPAYMAPEQVLQHSVSGRTDQYALGVTAFFLFTNRHIFDDFDTAMKVAVQHVSAQPKKISTLTDFGPQTDLVFGRCLAKKPRDRFDSCSEFVLALTEAIEADLVNAPAGAATKHNRATLDPHSTMNRVLAIEEPPNHRMLLYAFFVFSIGVGSLASVLVYKAYKRKAAEAVVESAAKAEKSPDNSESSADSQGPDETPPELTEETAATETVPATERASDTEAKPDPEPTENKVRTRRSNAKETTREKPPEPPPQKKVETQPDQTPKTTNTSTTSSEQKPEEKSKNPGNTLQDLIPGEFEY